MSISVAEIESDRWIGMEIDEWGTIVKRSVLCCVSGQEQGQGTKEKEKA